MQRTAKGQLPGSGSGGKTGPTGSARSYPSRKSGSSFRVPCTATRCTKGVSAGGSGNYGTKGT